MAVVGGRYAGPSVQINAALLAGQIGDLLPAIATIVFLDQPVPDGAAVDLIDSMVTALDHRQLDGLARGVAVTEAVKRVEGERVVEGIDRTRLAAVRCPEVIRRPVLAAAIAGIDGEDWINPMAVVAAAGGRIGIYLALIGSGVEPSAPTP